MCEQINTYLRGRRIMQRSGSLDCDSIQTERPDLTYCADPPQNGTDESSAFTECLSLMRHRMLRKETQITWMGIAIGVIGFLAAFFCILYLLHRRSLRKRQEMLEISTLKKIHSGEFGSGNATEMLLLKKPSPPPLAEVNIKKDEKS